MIIMMISMSVVVEYFVKVFGSMHVVDGFLFILLFGVVGLFGLNGVGKIILLCMFVIVFALDVGILSLLGCDFLCLVECVEICWWLGYLL